MTVKLTQIQRVLVAILYLIILIILFSIIDGNFIELITKNSEDQRIWFFSGALLIILGKYVAEPYFTKPTDSITNSAAIIITLLTLNNKEKLVFYEITLAVAFLVLILSLVTILLKNLEGNAVSRINSFSYQFGTKFHHN